MAAFHLSTHALSCFSVNTANNHFPWSPLVTNKRLFYLWDLKLVLGMHCSKRVITLFSFLHLQLPKSLQRQAAMSKSNACSSMRRLQLLLLPLMTLRTKFASSFTLFRTLDAAIIGTEALSQTADTSSLV